MTITRMDPNLYNAAANGNISYFQKHSFERPLESLLTPNKNTVVHIFITTLENGIESTDQKNFVGDILSLCPSLLCQVNVKDETPLHVAARYGHANIVEVLIERAKYPHTQDLGRGVDAVREMIRMVTMEKDTALHEAVRYNHLEVIKLLIKEDPDFSYSVNDAGETPLYIAAERNYKDLVLEILNTCNSPAYDGPLGRTALHAAVFWDYNEATIRAILEKFRGAITEKADQEGWTPLHLAAYLGQGNAQLLLRYDSKVAYMKDKEGRTALHIAAHRGKNVVMESIIDMCPDCFELVDNRGWNALHFAVEGDGPDSTESAVEFILENSSFSNLLNEKNAEGNMPLHHHSLSSGPYLKDLIDHSRVDKMAFNKNNLNAYQVALSAKLSTGKMKKMDAKLKFHPRRLFIEEKMLKKIEEDEFEDMRKKRKEYLEKAAATHLVVAALITTVTFAAAITMPGGFVGTGDDQHDYEGSAVLTRNVAFKVFIITDAISLVLSSSAVVTHLLMPLLFKYCESDETRNAFLRLAFGFILMAMGAMVLAFITGAYAVLVYSLDLAVTTCLIGLCFFFIISLICGLYRKDLGLSYIVENMVVKVGEFFLKVTVYMACCCGILMCWVLCIRTRSRVPALEDNTSQATSTACAAFPQQNATSISSADHSQQHAITDSGPYGIL